jgi:hypothetical protein
MTRTKRRRHSAHDRRRGKAVDNGGLRYSAMEGALARRCPPPPGAPLQETASRGAEIRTALTDPVKANIMTSDPRKQTSGGRHQIGTLAGFKSEPWPASVLELLAGFIGIRTSIGPQAAHILTSPHIYPIFPFWR